MRRFFTVLLFVIGMGVCLAVVPAAMAGTPVIAWETSFSSYSLFGPCLAAASFTDSDLTDAHSAVFDWGDNTNSAGQVTEYDGSGSVSGDHYYSAPGRYTITLTVTDSAGELDTAAFDCTVYPYEVSPGDLVLDSAGWSDPALGTWDPATQTGTLAADFSGDVRVFGAVTMEGGVHTVSGTLWANYHVDPSSYPTGPIITNASVVGDVYLATMATLSRSDVLGTVTVCDSGTVIVGNTISSPSGTGVYSDLYPFDSHGNVLDHCQVGMARGNAVYPTSVDNQFVACYIGLALDEHGCDPCSGNSFVRCEYGIIAGLGGLSGEHNDFIDCVTPVQFGIYAFGPSTLSSNYWSDWTTPDENGDGIVDLPRLCGLTGWGETPMYDTSCDVAPHRPLDGMSVNGGATATSSRSVTILSSQSGVELRIRNEGGAWSEWQTNMPSVSWTLPEGDGVKAVDVEYRDSEDTLLLLSDSIFLDTAKPSTTASAVTASPGTTATLSFTVADPTPSCGAATVTIQVLRGKKLVTTIPAGTMATNTPLTCEYAVTKKGTYTYRVLATDVAGNVANSTGSAKLSVR